MVETHVVDWLLLLLLGSILFAARDAMLLRLLSSRSCSFRLFVVYAVVLLGVFTTAGVIAEFVSREQALAMLRDARVWVPAIVVHAVAWIAFTRMRRAVLLLTFVPLPLFLFAAIGLCWIVLAETRSVSAAAIGAIAGVIWVAAVLLVSSRLPAGMAASAPSFAAASNLSAMVLLPMMQHSDQRVVSWQPDGSLLALGATVAMVGASFLFHRTRKAP